MKAQIATMKASRCSVFIAPFLVCLVRCGVGCAVGAVSSSAAEFIAFPMFSTVMDGDVLVGGGGPTFITGVLMGSLDASNSLISDMLLLVFVVFCRVFQPQ